MNRSSERLACFALSYLWIWSALSSVFFAPEIGYQVLAKGGVVGGAADMVVWAGGLLDIALGLWLLSGRAFRLCCVVQLVVVTVYSVLLTVIAPSFWVHPFGPLSKNIPIMVLIYILFQNEAKRET